MQCSTHLTHTLLTAAAADVTFTWICAMQCNLRGTLPILIFKIFQLLQTIRFPQSTGIPLHNYNYSYLEIFKSKDARQLPWHQSTR